MICGKSSGRCGSDGSEQLRIPGFFVLVGPVDKRLLVPSVDMLRPQIVPGNVEIGDLQYQ